MEGKSSTENNEEKNFLKKKIIVIVLIIIAIAGIWYYKNRIITKSGDSKNVEIREVEDNIFALEASNLNVEKLKTYGLPIILDFSAEWCGPCQIMEPELTNINNEMQGKAIIKKIDVDKNPKLADEFSVSAIPTQLFFNSNGSPYVPENTGDINFDLVKDENGNHILTRHVSILTSEEMKMILKEMGVDE